ncbi:MAG: hypothetical protein FWD70_05945, partial [Desulfuromonadales bacterium]|nr:hypothetical protein [Desulfuromonadales bacterium]
MNKIYKTIWKDDLCAWIPVAEITKSHKTSRNNKRKLSIAAIMGATALGLAFSSSAYAADQNIAPSWDLSNYQTNTYTLNGGSTINYVNSFSMATYSNPLFAVPYATLEAGGYIIQDFPDGINNHTETITLGAQNYSVSIPDITTSTLGAATLNVYDSNNFVLNTSDMASSNAFMIAQPAADSNIFNGLNLATVTNGTLNIDVTSDNLGNSTGTLSTSPQTIGAKNAVLFLAQSNGPADTANVALTRDMSVSFGDGVIPPAYGSNPQTAVVSGTIVTFAGTFQAFDGSTHTVTDITSLQAYNNWLVSELENGDMVTASGAQYASDLQTYYAQQLQKAYTQSNETYDITYNSTMGVYIDPNDVIYAPVVKQVVAQADGLGATATVENGVTVWLTTPRGPMFNYYPSGVLYGTNGGTVINNGLIAANNAGTIYLDSGSTGINNGIIDVGYLSTIDDPTPISGTINRESDITVSAGSTFTNNGIINTFTSDGGLTQSKYSGIDVYGGSTVINHGAINVSIVASTANNNFDGVFLSDAGSSFTNASDGVIYLGRSPSVDLSAAPIDQGGADVTTKHLRTTGVYAQAGTTAANEGNITIGSLTSQAFGMYAVGNGASITNETGGEIIVNGAVLGSQGGINNGMYIDGTGSSGSSVTTGTNDGTITLNGVNAIGLHIIYGGQATSTGDINVNGGYDATTKLRNYGVVSESPGSEVTITGAVNVIGDYAVGVMARQAGTVTIIDPGAVTLSTTATNQIGYYAYGVGSIIDNQSTGAEDAVGPNSTLYRVEAGATFLGGEGALSHLAASGQNSTVVAAVGYTGSTPSTFNSGNMTIDVSGENSTGVLVQGGAQGKISDLATINLTGDGATAGVADGQWVNIQEAKSGGLVTGAVGDPTLDAGAAGFGTGTLLVGDADLNSSMNDVTGYLAMNGGTVANTGDIDFSGTNTTGIKVLAGSAGINYGTITIQDSGIALWATGEGAKATAMDGSTINVDNDNAQAILVQGGATGILNAGAIINLNGVDDIIGTSDGNEYGTDGVTVIRNSANSNLISYLTIDTTTPDSTGFIAQNNGTFTNNGDITFSGVDSNAVKVLSGNFVNNGSVTADGTAVYVEGANSTIQNNDGGAILATDGRAAIELGPDANLNLVGAGASTIEGQGTADAVLIDPGAAGLTVNGAHLIVAAADATGNGIENAGEISGIQLLNTTIDVVDGKGVRTATSLASINTGTINVAGSGIGIAFETATGTASANPLDLSSSPGLTINVDDPTGTGGTGILANTTGDVKTAVTVNVGATGGSALLLGAATTTATNSGALTSASTAPVVDATAPSGETFTNDTAGVITAASTTNTAVKFGSGNDNFINSGIVTGIVDLGNGTNTALLNTNSSTTSVVGGTGSDTVTVKGNAAFTLLDGGIGSGSDTLIFDGATHTLSAASDINHFETMNLINDSTITTADPIKMTDTAGGVGAIFIEDGSTLAIATPAGYTLDHTLTGTGLITATMVNGADALNFGSGTGSAFAGTVELGTGSFNLSGYNTTALTHATLWLDTGNTTTVGNGQQTIGNLTINGATVIFNAHVPSDLVSPANILTTNLDVSGGGTVQIDPSSFDNSQPLPNTSLPLLQQDDVTAMTRLIQATGAVTGTGGDLTLTDLNGNPITDAQTVDILQNGTKVAEGIYDYDLLTSSNGTTQDGLYVGYGLHEIDLIGKG